MSAIAQHRSVVAQGGYTAVENVYLFDTSLSAGALRLYGALKHFSWKNDGEIPSQVELAKALGTTDRSIRDDFKELEGRKLVTVTRESGKPNLVVIEAPEDSSAVPRKILPGSRKGVSSTRARVRGEDLKTSSSETSSPQKVSVSESDIKIVYDCWRHERKRSRANYDKISAARRKKIVTRLKEFSAEELCNAIRAVAFDPWEWRKQHDDVTVILGSQEKVDRWLELWEAGKRTTTKDRHDELRRAVAEHDGRRAA